MQLSIPLGELDFLGLGAYLTAYLTDIEFFQFPLGN